MFWKDVVKTTTKISFVLSFIGLLITAFDEKGPFSQIPFIIVILVGSVLIFVSHSFLFMICEFIEMVESIEYKLAVIKGAQPITSEALHYPNDGKALHYSNDKNAKSVSNDIWKCSKCGKSNPRSNRVCMDCGQER